MHELITYLVAAMVAWVPPAEHWRENRDVVVWRYARIVDTVVDVAAEDPLVPPGESLPSVVWTATLLLSVASFESAYRHDVDMCQVVDARGARSLWQIEGSRYDVCKSRADAARVALALIRQSIDACRGKGDALSLYTTGRCIANREARLRMVRAVRWWRGPSTCKLPT